jgi:hypothetical protein
VAIAIAGKPAASTERRERVILLSAVIAVVSRSPGMAGFLCDWLALYHDPRANVTPAHLRHKRQAPAEESLVRIS